MTATIRDTTYALRQGQLIALADETGWSVAVDPVNDAAVEQLLTLSPANTSAGPTALIPNTDGLILYVAKLPDVAYDLVEFAEDPLTVVYEQGKNVSSVLWDKASTGPIAVRRSLDSAVQRLLGGFGRGLLTMPFESLILPPDVDNQISIRYGTLPAQGMEHRVRRTETWSAPHGANQTKQQTVSTAPRCQTTLPG